MRTVADLHEWGAHHALPQLLEKQAIGKELSFDKVCDVICVGATTWHVIQFCIKSIFCITFMLGYLCSM